MNLISVILPTCDRPLLLARALRSVLSQEGVDFEVLLVDSNRETPAVAEIDELAELLSDARVRVVVPNPPPQNAAQARNAGLDAARGRWISYLDDDDEYLPGKLKRQLALAETTNANLVICGYKVVMPHRVRVRQCQQTVFEGDECLVKANYPTPVMFHRADVPVRFEPELRSGHDHVFAIDLLAHCRDLRVPCEPEALLVAHAHQGARVNRGNRAAVWKSHRVCLRRHRLLFSRDARRAFIAVGLLVRDQGNEVAWSIYAKSLWRIFATQGFAGWRLVVNAIAVRSPILRRWVVT